MVEKIEDSFLLAWASVVEGHALTIKQIEKRLNGVTPLTLDEYDLLLAVSRAAGGKIRLSSLAEATVLTRSGVTRVVDRLLKRGFLGRQGCDEDKRGAYAILTDTGKAAMKETWRQYSKAIREVFGKHLTEAEASALRLSMEKVIGALRESPLVQLSRVKT